MLGFKLNYVTKMDSRAICCFGISSWKPHDLSYKVSAMPGDDLVMQQARSAVAIVLT